MHNLRNILTKLTFLLLFAFVSVGFGQDAFQQQLQRDAERRRAVDRAFQEQLQRDAERRRAADRAFQDQLQRDAERRRAADRAWQERLQLEGQQRAQLRQAPSYSPPRYTSPIYAEEVFVGDAPTVVSPPKRAQTFPAEREWLPIEPNTVAINGHRVPKEADAYRMLPGGEIEYRVPVRIDAQQWRDFAVAKLKLAEETAVGKISKDRADDAVFFEEQRKAVEGLKSESLRRILQNSLAAEQTKREALRSEFATEVKTAFAEARGLVEEELNQVVSGKDSLSEHRARRAKIAKQSWEDDRTVKVNQHWVVEKNRREKELVIPSKLGEYEAQLLTWKFDSQKSAEKWHDEGVKRRVVELGEADVKALGRERASGEKLTLLELATEVGQRIVTENDRRSAYRTQVQEKLGQFMAERQTWLGQEVDTLLGEYLRLAGSTDQSVHQGRLKQYVDRCKEQDLALDSLWTLEQARRKQDLVSVQFLAANAPAYAALVEWRKARNGEILAWSAVQTQKWVVAKQNELKSWRDAEMAISSQVEAATIGAEAKAHLTAEITAREKAILETVKRIGDECQRRLAAMENLYQETWKAIDTVGVSADTKLRDQKWSAIAGGFAEFDAVTETQAGLAVAGQNASYLPMTEWTRLSSLYGKVQAGKEQALSEVTVWKTEKGLVLANQETVEQLAWEQAEKKDLEILLEPRLVQEATIDLQTETKRRIDTIVAMKRRLDDEFARRKQAVQKHYSWLWDQTKLKRAAVSEESALAAYQPTSVTFAAFDREADEAWRAETQKRTAQKYPVGYWKKADVALKGSFEALSKARAERLQWKDTSGKAWVVDETTSLTTWTLSEAQTLEKIAFARLRDAIAAEYAKERDRRKQHVSDMEKAISVEEDAAKAFYQTKVNEIISSLREGKTSESIAAELTGTLATEQTRASARIAELAAVRETHVKAIAAHPTVATSLRREEAKYPVRLPLSAGCPKGARFSLRREIDEKTSVSYLPKAGKETVLVTDVAGMISLVCVEDSVLVLAKTITVAGHVVAKPNPESTTDLVGLSQETNGSGNLALFHQATLVLAMKPYTPELLQFHSAKYDAERERFRIWLKQGGEGFQEFIHEVRRDGTGLDAAAWEAP